MVSTAAFHARVRGSVPGLGGLKETKLFLPHPRVKVSIVGSLRDREVACSASDRQGSNFESCVWRTVSSQSSHHPHEVLLAQFSLYVHKGGLKPDSFHFFLDLTLQFRAWLVQKGLVLWHVSWLTNGVGKAWITWQKWNMTSCYLTRTWLTWVEFTWWMTEGGYNIDPAQWSMHTVLDRIAMT